MPEEQLNGRWTRGRMVKLIWSTCFYLIAGAYTVAVVRTLIDGGSLPSALWLPDGPRREWFLGTSIATLVVALAAFGITSFWWRRKRTA